MKAVWFRIVFMVIAFGLVLLAMRGVKKGGLGVVLNELLGLPVPATQSTAPSVERLTWCSTRVRGLEIPGQMKISQTGLKWVRERGERERAELNGLAVEKWLGQFCSVYVEVLPTQLTSAGSVGSEALVVHFIKGASEVLTSAVTGSKPDQDLAAGKDSVEPIYSWRGMLFRSRELSQGLTALRELPEVSAAGQKPQDH